MVIDFGAVLTSCPPKYKATCESCGNIEYPDCSKCSEEYLEYIRNMVL